MINALKRHNVQRLQVRMYPRISFLGRFRDYIGMDLFEESKIDLIDTNRKKCVKSTDPHNYTKKKPMIIFLKYTSGFNGKLFAVYKSFVVSLTPLL